MPIIVSKKINYKQIYLLCRQISIMLYSGVNVVSAFTIIKEQTKNKKAYRALNSIVKSIHSGHSLYDSVKNTRYFEDSFLEMVKVGEETGKLDIIFDKLSNYYYKEYKTKQAIKEAMTYPIFILVVTIIASIIMMFTILPMIQDMIKSLSLSNIPLPTKVLLQLSSIVENRGFALSIISIFLILVFLCIRFREVIFHRVLSKLSPIASVYKMILAEKFARSLSLLWVSGVPIIESLSLCESLLGKYYRKGITNIKHLVEGGSSLYLAIQSSNIFPEFFSNMIETGEESGRLDSVLNSIGDFYEIEIAFSLKKATKIFEPFLIICLSLAVGFILSGVLLPIFQIYAQV